MAKTIIIKKEYKIGPGADLICAYLEGANLSGVDLMGADLIGADLTDANLRSTDLRGADLRGADLTGADFTGAYLRGIKYNSNTRYDGGSTLDLYIKSLESKVDK